MLRRPAEAIELSPATLLSEHTRSLSVLVLAPFLPWPLTAGNRVRLFNFIDELASRHRVTVLAQVSRTNDSASIEQFSENLRSLGVVLHVVEQPNTNMGLLARAYMRALYEIRHASSGVLTGEHYSNSSRFRLAAKRLADAGHFDIVFTTYFYCGIPEILQSGTPVVCDANDILWVNAKMALGMSGRVLERLKRRETAVFSRCGGIVCVHEHDADIVRNMVGSSKPVVSIAHTRSRQGLVSVDPRLGAGSVVAFYGDLASAMNRDALSLLISEVWPAIRLAEPGASLVVFGRSGEDMEPTLRRAGARYLGVCEDLSATLAAVDVVVLPLRLGSGLKGRILECMELGVPVVGTSNAFVGIPVRSGEEAIVADSAVDLAAGCVSLLRSGVLRRQVSQAGKRYFDQRYSQAKTYGAIHEFLEGIVGAG